MRFALQVFRLLVLTGWLIPIALMTGPGDTSIGIALPLWMPACTAILFVLLFSAMEPWAAQVDSRWLRLGQFIAVVAAGAGLAWASFRVTGATLSFEAWLIDWVLFALTGGIALRIAASDASYRGMLRDMRMGITCLVAFPLLAAVTHQQLSSGRDVYLAATGYLVFSVIGVAAARRYAFDELSRDSRGARVEGDFLRTVGILAGLLAVFSLVLVQLFGYDIAALIGYILSPVTGALSAIGHFGGDHLGRGPGGIHIALGGPGRAIGGFMAASGHWLGHGGAVIGAGIYFLLTPLRSFQHWLMHWGGGSDGGSTQPPNPGGPRFQPKPTTGEGTYESLLKAILVGVVGLVIVGSLARGATAASRRRRPKGRRTSTWSWKQAAPWLLAQTKSELSAVGAALPHFDRKPVIGSVRDVYRAFLWTGRKRFRPRAAGETGHEYSAAIAGRWPASQEPLAELNTLYMAERYGARLAGPRLIDQAKGHLRAIELSIP